MTDTTLLPCRRCKTMPRLMPNGIGDYFVTCRGEEDELHCGISTSDVRCETPEMATKRWNEVMADDPAWNRRDPWRTIESAPKDGTVFLAYSPAAAENRRPEAVFHAERWNPAYDQWDHSNWHCWPPTHWMPLPTPPAPVSGGK